jgi:hypothetical protein
MHNVLIVGNVDRIEILSNNTDFDIVFAANYEEATKLLKKPKKIQFGHVITAAVLSNNKSGMDVLRTICENIPKKDWPCTVVCHTETICTADDRKWNISVSLQANYTFATFHLGTVNDYWLNHGNQLQQCA